MRNKTRGTSGDWTIVYGTREGLQKYGVDELNRLVQRNVTYSVKVIDSSVADKSLLRQNLVLIGTKKDNSVISLLIEKGVVSRTQSGPETLHVQVISNPHNPEAQIIVLTGSDAAGVVYAIRDFEHYVVDPLTRVDSDGKIDRLAFRGASFDPVDIQKTPSIRERGLWTWGHVIYDFKKYIDHMNKWKMNTLIVWNDFAPVNAREIVDYAHSRGIRIIWGYSWGWGEDDEIDPCNSASLEEWRRKALATYENNYRDSETNGIYFQIFTEIKETEIKGHNVADLAVKWVNEIGRSLLEKYPDLRIYFGLHATSIQSHFRKLKLVDERINIVWEDVLAFPYSYQPDDIEKADQAIAYTKEIVKLRGNGERFGAVFKGMINLDWNSFEHQTGPYLMGISDEGFIDSRAREKSLRWKHVERFYRQNLDYVLRTIQVIADSNTSSCVTTLVEDGLWERFMWMPVCLFAEALWDPSIAKDELIQKVGLTEDVYVQL